MRGRAPAGRPDSKGGTWNPRLPFPRWREPRQVRRVRRTNTSRRTPRHRPSRQGPREEERPHSGPRRLPPSRTPPPIANSMRPRPAERRQDPLSLRPRPGVAPRAVRWRACPEVSPASPLEVGGAPRRRPGSPRSPRICTRRLAYTPPLASFNVSATALLEAARVPPPRRSRRPQGDRRGYRFRRNSEMGRFPSGREPRQLREGA